VEAFTVATPTALLDHVPPGTVEAKVVVPATQIVWVPLRIPAFAGAETSTILVAVATFEQPLDPITV
jgi:hypothetical protein